MSNVVYLNKLTEEQKRKLEIKANIRGEEIARLNHMKVMALNWDLMNQVNQGLKPKRTRKAG